MYSHDEIEALTTKIRWMAVDLLGDRVSAVEVEARDHNYFMGIAVQSSEGWRHGVGGETADAMADPDSWTRAACDTLSVRMKVKAAEQPGTA
jgi:hypothetical protein